VGCVESQAGKFCWGENRKETEEHLARFLDYSKMAPGFKDRQYYDDGFVELKWLLEHVPCLHKSLYTRGQKFLDEAILGEVNKKKKRTFRKGLEDLNELMEKYFGDS